jgi:hypothetical protein
MNREELTAHAREITTGRITEDMDLDQKTTLFESVMMELLDIQIMTPPLGRMATLASGGLPRANGRWLMGDDPRLPEMPAQPTLLDFFRHRLLLDRRGGNHLLQSAALAQENSLSEHMVLACLLHDISVISLVRSDHGHWGAQLVAPYVDEEVTWSIRHHQALKFFPDTDYGYVYPQLYVDVFGADYEPPDYIKREWEYCRGHRWYGSAMQVCVNDLYAFDPDKIVHLEQFEDVIAKHFKQPEQGLGFDGSPVAHMWRTLIWPNNFL